MDPIPGAAIYDSENSISGEINDQNDPELQSISPQPRDENEKENKSSLGIKVKRKSRRGRSSGSLTMKGDKITSFTTERGITYSPNDHVYIENNRHHNPYFICSILDFSVVKRDTLVLRVKWYYRVTEVPDSVYQHLVQDRYSQKIESDHPLLNPAVKARELFCSEATDTYPVTALRGKCRVVHCNSLEAARTFHPAADTFYCILGYNPETKRLATTQGQIRVGSMYQARMPECKPNVPPHEMPERSSLLEEFQWQPKGVLDGDLMMFLRAARSVAAFAGMCDGGNTDGCQAAAMDDTTLNAMHMLHRYDYDTGKALQGLVKAPALRTIDKKWNEEDTKRFVKGLRVYGKNFFKIRKELLPTKETGELVEYYYFWKKTPAAASNRPHRRHRKHGVKRATTRSQRPASSEFLDLSSSSNSDNDSEDSDGLSGFRCQNCLVTVSKDWNNVGKPCQRCTKCRLFFKKYGVDRPISGDSPYFQPLRDGDINGTHSMLTRQHRNSTDSKEKKKGSASETSVDNLDSPSSDSKKSLVPSSPSALSTCSSSSDRDKKKRLSESPDKEKKRRHIGSDGEDKFPKRQRSGPSESDSLSDSSISGAEETQNEADETNADDLSSSSPPTSPSPVDLDKDKVPIPVESTISGEKRAELPRPEPEYPSPNRPPIETSPLIPPHLPPGGHIPLASTHIPQGFVPLPPLPAFVFPQTKYPPPLEPIYHRPPQVSEASTSPIPPPSVSDTDSRSESSESRTIASCETRTEPCASDVGVNGNNSGVESREPSVISGPRIKEEVITPPPSPIKVSIKQEPIDSLDFMSSLAQNVGNSETKPGLDRFSANKDMCSPLLTPKLEPMVVNSQFSGSSSSYHPPPLHSSNHSNADQPRADMTLQAEVKVQQEQGESQGREKGQVEGERSEVEFEEESDSDREGTLTPGPVPTPCNKEILRSKSAIFIKLLNRGEYNSCSRCDLMFKPFPDSKLAKKREHGDRKPTPASTPAKDDVKRKMESPRPSPRPSSTSDAQVVSNVPPSHHSHGDRVTPRSYPDTPALRQLSEYAKPHALAGQDPRGMPGYLGYPFMDPIRMATMYPPNSRERLELELERDKRERDARERELREQELRSLEMREKLKAEMEMKPPGYERLSPLGENPNWLEFQRRNGPQMQGLERLLPPGANPLDPHWLEFQRRYGPHMLGGAGASHLPGIYPPTSLASDLMARERERLERLGLHPSHMLGDSGAYAAMMERLSAERMSAERMSAERIQAERLQAMQDPMMRFQMSGMAGPAAAAAAAAAAQQHAHTHTHAHSHTHLHLHQPDLIPPPPVSTPHGFLPPTSSAMPHLFLPPHMLHTLPPGADPMSGVNGASNQTPPGSLPSLPVGMPPPHMMSREQELSDLYRRAYTDPALAQQLHHEALQRMALERDRFGSGHLPPPH
ncbi:arginine-glutamic acid dipeptide repeats protein-like isoform X2 [Mya arenaria]|uniref:arginine-glutamic acid dipeptide repeats protein-like isoform X2 n=1 Tax=Mya arenaria TaxID=6604 RepID=UPI0022E2F046|nr:arginine-glutamic acid dipeptide repeats protein-like isoform X2 [Mya arenaria]